MRVLIVAACPFPSHQGTQVMLHQLCHALAPYVSLSLLVYGYGAGDIDAFDKQVPYNVLRANTVPGQDSLRSGPAWDKPLADAHLLAAALRELTTARACGNPYDLVHTHNYEGAIAGAIAARFDGIPCLYHAHNRMEDELPSYVSSRGTKHLLARFGRLLDATIPGMAHRAVALTLPAAQALSRLNPRLGDVSVIPPGIDVTPCAPRQTDTDFVYAGNLDGYQNMPLLVKALGRLDFAFKAEIFTNSESSDLHQHLVRQRLATCTAIRPHANFQQVFERMQRTSIALLPRVVPSGFPIKLLNYLAAGCAVVACESSAHGLSAEHGVVVVPDNDSVAFAHAMRALWADPGRRSALRSAAVETAKSFHWDQIAPRVLALYQSVTGDRP